MQQHNIWCGYVCSVWRGVPDCSPAYLSICALFEAVCRTAVRHTSPNRAHVPTPYVMLLHHHTNFLHSSQNLKSVTLIRNIWAPWRWSEWDRNKLERF